MRIALALILLTAVPALCLFAPQNPQDLEQRNSKKKKKKPSNKKDIEPVTQVLPLPKELPAAVTVETQRLVFDVSPLSNKGLLTQQTRDALKTLLSSKRNDNIVKLRAFVAGSGDTRRVSTIVSEVFTERHEQLPVLTTVLVGSLGVEGAQILFESTAIEKRPVNPYGLLFISGKGGKTFSEAVSQVKQSVRSVGGAEADLLRVTCFVNNFDIAQPDRQFPISGVAYSVVQMRREPSPTVAECEAIARLPKPQAEPVKFINPAGLPTSPNFSQLAAVSAPRITLSGLQLSFNSTEADVHLAFTRLGKTLDSQSVTYKNVFFTSIYALTQEAIDRVRALRFNYLDKTNPPASTLLPFEGLPSIEATLGMEVFAAAPGS